MCPANPHRIVRTLLPATNPNGCDTFADTMHVTYGVQIHWTG